MAKRFNPASEDLAECRQRIDALERKLTSCSLSNLRLRKKLRESEAAVEQLLLDDGGFDEQTL